MLKKAIIAVLIIATLVTGLFMVSAFSEEAEEWPLSIRVNDVEVIFPDAQPFVDGNSRTQVPVRFVSEALEASVEWIDATSQVSIVKDETTILLTIGKKEMTINGGIKTLDSAPLLKDSRTFVPIRFVSEALGATIDWEAITNTVYIDTRGKAVSNDDRVEIKDAVVNIGGGTVKNESGDIAAVEFGQSKVLKESGAMFTATNDMIIIGIADGEGSNFDTAIAQIEAYLVQIIDGDSVKKIVELAKNNHSPRETGFEERLSSNNKTIVFTTSTSGFVNIAIFSE